MSNPRIPDHRLTESSEIHFLVTFLIHKLTHKGVVFTISKQSDSRAFKAHTHTLIFFLSLYVYPQHLFFSPSATIKLFTFYTKFERKKREINLEISLRKISYMWEQCHGPLPSPLTARRLAFLKRRMSMKPRTTQSVG